MNTEMRCIFNDQTWPDMPTRDELISHMRDVHQGNLEYMTDEELFVYLNMRPMFNSFRENYDKLTFDEIKRHYNTVHIVQPGQKRFNATIWTEIFKYLLPREDVCIFELGGYNGELYNHINRTLPGNRICGWLNCELSSVQSLNMIGDAYYLVEMHRNFAWENEDILENMKHMECNVFVASHVIEHISWNQLVLLADTIISKIPYFFLEIPLPKDPNEKANWHDYNGYHVLECSWNEIRDLFHSRGFSTMLFADTGHLIGVKQ